MIVRRTLIGLVSMLMLPTAVRAQAIDPNSLLGQWNGDVEGPVPVRYFLSLTSVEGQTIKGRARTEFQGKSGQYNIAGTLQGNVFTYKSLSHDLVVELTVAGDTMTGHGERTKSGAAGKFSLKRVR